MIKIIQGDITTLAVDAIVNATSAETLRCRLLPLAWSIVSKFFEKE